MISSIYLLHSSTDLHSRFPIDFIGSFPFEMLAPAFYEEVNMTQQQLIYLLRLPGLMRTARLVGNVRLNTRFWRGNKVRILKLAIFFFIMAHWIACMFFYVGTHQPAGTATWVDDMIAAEQSPAHMYTTSLYWALTTLVTVGYGDISPQSRYERAFAAPILIASALIFAIIFGNVSFAIESINAPFRREQNKLDMVEEFVRSYELSPHLEHKLYAYTNEIWHQSRGFDLTAIMSDVPISVRSEIMLHLHHALVSSVPLFNGCAERFLQHVIMNLKNLICLEGDFIFFQYDKSRELYFVRSGCVEVMQVKSKQASARDGQSIAQLHEGSFFGEISLLLSVPRSGSVRAITRTDLSFIEPQDFLHILAEYSEYKQQMRRVAKERLAMDAMRDKHASDPLLTTRVEMNGQRARQAAQKITSLSSLTSHVFTTEHALRKMAKDNSAIVTGHTPTGSTRFWDARDQVRAITFSLLSIISRLCYLSLTLIFRSFTLGRSTRHATC
jgi:voltage-gated potassium channel